MNNYLSHKNIDALLNILQTKGYNCLGPQVQDGTIVYKTLTSSAQLPWGIREVQSPGKYSLEKTGTDEAFAWSNGPQGIKPLLFKPKESLWRVERDDKGKLCFIESKPEVTPIALFGVRACDVAGMLIQDRAFIENEFKDKHYKAQRENLFVIVVNCGYSGGNCFCVSTNTGPKADKGFDIALTEIEGGFVLEIGSDKGEEVTKELNLVAAKEYQAKQAKSNIERAEKMQTKSMPKNNSRELRDILMNNLDHPRWDEVASRCLSCGNCTSVCPTCFCHQQTETPSIDMKSSEHERQWDSCFSAGHSYIHNKVIRDDTKSRYKQWLTHKLATWWDQFDTSGCVGCGRCVSWCPVEIDITEEVAALTGDSNVAPSTDKD